MEISLIVDANSLIHTAYYGYRDRLDKPGAGFFVMLYKAIVSHDAGRVYLAFDSKTNVRSKYNDTLESFDKPAYKSGRDRPDDMDDNIQMVKDYCVKALQSEVIECEGYEADDVINSVARDLDGRRIVLSGDKDLLVLSALPDVFVSRTQRGTKINFLGEEVPLTFSDYRLWGGKEFNDEFGHYPFQYTIWKSLVGDSSDKIPGARNVGPGRANRVINLLDPLELQEIFLKEEIVRNHFAGKWVDDLYESEGLVRLSYELARLREPEVKVKDGYIDRDKLERARNYVLNKAQETEYA